MKTLITLLLAIAGISLSAQGVISTDTVKSPDAKKNFVKALHSDSLSSSFIIEIPAEVKLHYHAHHTEQVVVLSGEADMRLGDQNIHIKAGDVVFIPKGTPHSAKVTSPVPLRIISIQAPYFDGSDRIMLEK
ncbi:MAG: cupin domain-containing protein [Bacteroidia bacterium]|nr:cupin domain-containing protein [Bacteroidia bacterium]